MNIDRFLEALSVILSEQYKTNVKVRGEKS